MQKHLPEMRFWQNIYASNKETSIVRSSSASTLISLSHDSTSFCSNRGFLAYSFILGPYLVLLVICTAAEPEVMEALYKHWWYYNLQSQKIRNERYSKNKFFIVHQLKLRQIPIHPNLCSQFPPGWNPPFWVPPLSEANLKSYPRHSESHPNWCM